MPSVAMGYLAVMVAAVFFGSNFVPVKRYETHDGMYYQWVMCSGVWMVGLFIQMVLFASPPTTDGSWGPDGIWNATDPNMPPGTANPMWLTGRPDAYSVKFMPMACLGGVLWATGNTMSVDIINRIGLSLGILIWGSANMLMGWATGIFGLFTGHADHFAPHTDHATLNYVGVGCAVLALSLYTQVKSGEPSREKLLNTPSSTQPLSAQSALANEAPDVDLLAPPAPEPNHKDSASSKAIGIVMAIVAGLLFGNTFTPPEVLRKNHHGPAQSLDYVFSHYTGIFATSTVWFILYCAYMRGSPRINPRLTLPGLLSGVMWGIAQACWFIANDALSVTVAFPIITSGPGIVSAMWGVFVFGEIRGARNYAVLGAAIFFALIGCVLIGMSSPIGS